MKNETALSIILKYGYANNDVNAAKMFLSYNWTINDSVELLYLSSVIYPHQSVQCGNTIRFSPQDFNGMREVTFR